MDHGWMRIVLDALFAEIPPEKAREAISDVAALADLRSHLQTDALGGGRLGTIPAGTKGDNLLQGIIALRLKFPEAVAREKLEVNIAMREGRAP